MRLARRAAIVTGAAQGLGWAIAERFAREGAKVLIADLNETKAGERAKALKAEGFVAHPFEANVGTGSDVLRMVDFALDRLGAVDILVNNAGGAGDVSSIDIEDVTDSAWDDVLQQNLTGTFLCCRAVIPHMKAKGYGRIINMSSGLATGVGRLQGTGGATMAYAAAKAGILGLTYTLAKAVAPSNITVNALVPGFMLTEPGARVRDWFDTLPEDAKSALLSRNSMGRAGDPGELASLALFLASEECSYVSGTAINIHGAG